MTHKKLVDITRKYFIKRGWPVVITEMRTYADNIPDVLVFSQKEVQMYEIKVSRADFLKDLKKPRHTPFGSKRYYVAPKGLIKTDELPAGWGLFEWDGKRMLKTEGSILFNDCDPSAERGILISALRRMGRQECEGVSVRIYTYSTKCSSTLSLIEDDE